MLFALGLCFSERRVIQVVKTEVFKAFIATKTCWFIWRSVIRNRVVRSNRHIAIYAALHTFYTHGYQSQVSWDNLEPSFNSCMMKHRTSVLIRDIKKVFLARLKTCL